jgi:hypothetical protein
LAKQRYRHFLLEATVHTAPPSRPSIPRGDKKPDRNREEHARKLLAQLSRLAEASAKTAAERGDLGFSHLNGQLVEISGESGYELPVESLESTRHNVELVGVKTVDDATIATVFFPDGTLPVLENKVQQYANEDVPPKSGTNNAPPKPKNDKLVSAISGVRMRRLRGAWCDADAACPEAGVDCRLELWIRAGDAPDELAAALVQEARLHGIVLSDKFLAFQDYLVVNVVTSLTKLAHSQLFSQAVAEIRRSQEPADFFTQMTAREQRSWHADLEDRLTHVPSDCYVTVLDSGITSGHPLFRGMLHPDDCHTVEESWGTHDTHRHGTLQAGLAVFGDLTRPLAKNSAVVVRHSLESVKLIAPEDALQQNENFGLETQQAVALVEIQRPNIPRRVFCLSVTGKNIPDQGRPTAWSSAVDRMCFEDGRLFLISAGNRSRERVAEPRSEMLDQVQDPGQAWNALTVGAYTRKTKLTPELAKFGQVLARAGTLCPSSTTSEGWRSDYPIKPEIVMEGGNYFVAPASDPDTPDCLQLVSTSPLAGTGRLFGAHGDTSAAAALASRLAARIWAKYPSLRAESVRAILVHSARWQPAMLEHLHDNNMESLLRNYGYGVPNGELALSSLQHSATMIYEGGLEVRKSNSSIAFHTLPWPADFLVDLGALEVRLRVTLSYYVEPRPGPRISDGRHSFHSHKLRFSFRRPGEDQHTFEQRVSTQYVDQSVSQWMLGHHRYRMAVHSDVWTGEARRAAERGSIAVWPSLGWWGKNRGPEVREVPYSLLISLETDDEEVNLAAAVESAISVFQETAVGISIDS